MTPRSKLSVGLLFTACAGYIDAVGVVELGGYFISFVSGNTTRLGASIGQGVAGMAALPLALVVMFFIGALAGSLAATSNKRWGSVAALSLVVAVVVISLGLSLAGVPTRAAMVALAAAGGAQNAVLAPAGAARLGATFVTGTLFAAAQDLANAIRGTVPRWRWAQHLAVWAALCAGAALGAAVDEQWGLSALVVPALIYAGFLVQFVLVAMREARPAL